MLLLWTCYNMPRFTKGRPSVSFLLNHRYLKHSFLISSRTPFVFNAKEWEKLDNLQLRVV